MTVTNDPNVGNIAQLPDGGQENLGLAPTTPSTVSDNQLSTPPAPPAPTSDAPTKTIVQPNYVQPVQPHPMSRVYDGILKNLSGGPIFYTDANGVRQEAPQTKTTMAKSILASVLAGLMTPTVRNPDGTVDASSTMGGAAAAGVASRQARVDQAQQLSNQEQARKLATIQNNAKLVYLQASAAHMKHVMLAEQTQNAKQFLGPLEEYESLRTAANDPNQPQAFLARNLSAADVTNNTSYKLTDSNVVVDGTRQVYNAETKQMEEEPTYAVLNPDLKAVKLTPEVTNKLAEINSQWQDIHQIGRAHV